MQIGCGASVLKKNCHRIKTVSTNCGTVFNSMTIDATFILQPNKRVVNITFSSYHKKNFSNSSWVISCDNALASWYKWTFCTSVLPNGATKVPTACTITTAKQNKHAIIVNKHHSKKLLQTAHWTKWREHYNVSVLYFWIHCETKTTNTVLLTKLQIKK